MPTLHALPKVYSNVAKIPCGLSLVPWPVTGLSPGAGQSLQEWDIYTANTQSSPWKLLYTPTEKVVSFLGHS